MDDHDSWRPTPWTASTEHTIQRIRQDNQLLLMAAMADHLVVDIVVRFGFMGYIFIRRITRFCALNQGLVGFVVHGALPSLGG